MAITLQDHKKVTTSKIVAKFAEEKDVKLGFAGFFPEETVATEYVDIEVERDNDYIAVDVQRFTEGNKNRSTKSTEKKYKPPFFKEDYDFNRDEVYLNSVGQGVFTSASANATIANNALKEIKRNKKKIQRAIRKQQADVLQTGIVTLKNGDSINYGRKAESLKVLSTTRYWNLETADIQADLADAMKFLREEGNSNGDTVNVVMRTKAMNALLSNSKLEKVLNSRRMNRANIVMPQFENTTGLAFHGQMAAGDFSVNLWTYNEKYTDKDTGNTIYYLDENRVLVIPSDFQGKTYFGALPYMREASIGGVKTEVPALKEIKYLLRAYSDKKTVSSTIELTSAPLVVPISVDKMYTMTVFDDGNG